MWNMNQFKNSQDSKLIEDNNTFSCTNHLRRFWLRTCSKTAFCTDELRLSNREVCSDYLQAHSIASAAFWYIGSPFCSLAVRNKLIKWRQLQKFLSIYHDCFFGIMFLRLSRRLFLRYPNEGHNPCSIPKNSWVQNSDVCKIVKYSVIVWGVVKTQVLSSEFKINILNYEKGNERRIFR